MRVFTTDELSRMQATQEDAMQDTCKLYARTDGAQDDYGYPATTWTLLYTGACGLDPTAKAEAMDGAEVGMIDAKLRLPLAQADNVTSVARVEITHRYGVALTTPVVYAVDSEAERGPSGLVLNLVLVTDGSGVS